MKKMASAKTVFVMGLQVSVRIVIWKPESVNVDLELLDQGVILV
jgi:hypothetical protein